MIVHDKETRMRHVSKVPVTIEGSLAQGRRRNWPMGRPRVFEGNRKRHQAYQSNSFMMRAPADH